MSHPKPPRTPGLIQKGLSRIFPEKPSPRAEAPGSVAPGPGAPAPEAPARPTATLAAVAQLRIQFLDNARRPLYPLPDRGTSPLSRDEEHVALGRCLEAIHEAKAAGRILGKPAAGMYEGREPEAVMAEANAEDLKRFLAFALANARSFMPQPMRLSEAFLAWLVDRGAP
ncbi:hypothetical protein D3C86_612740 [compost metagenome]